MHSRDLPLDVAPWVLFRALAGKERPFFIDAAQPWDNEWVSSMGFHPRMQFRVAACDGASGLAAGLDALAAALAAVCPPAVAPDRRIVPFAGGAVVALAYEANDGSERAVHTQPEEPDAPRLVAAVYDAVVAYRHREGRWTVASWVLGGAALARFADEVLDAAADAHRRAGDERDVERRGTLELRCNLRPDEYRSRVARVHRYIAAGDAYQVNLSQRFRAALPCPPLDLYGRLRAVQPVPFGGYFDLGREQVLSNSPELFLRRRGDRVATCPIKGTHPRGATAADDARLAEALARDPKERAEHVMIVDLERNDLGRICRTGTVRVPRFCERASFRTVHHLVSTVEGRLRDGVGIRDCLRATFPGGSITGAPKIRAMQIIDELERGPRGFYTGTLGWIDTSGDCDLNVAIRTATARDGVLTYHAGGGIVADSVAEREHAECLLKAAAFFRALGVAVEPRSSIADELTPPAGVPS